MAAAADDLARRLAAFIPLPQPPQKEQLSGVAAAVLDAGGRLGRAVGDVFRRLRIDDGLDVAFAQRHRRNGGARIAAAAAVDARVSKDSGGGGVAGQHDPGSMNLSATYDSRTSDVESSVVARGDLWRAEASHSSAAAAAPPLFMVQLGPVLFVRDTTLLFPVHLSKRHLIWYGFERKNGVHSVCPAYWSAHRRWFFMSMICLNPFTCIGRSKLNGSAASSGLVLRVDAPLHSFGRPWFSIQMNSGLEF
uniref:Uncharacterized protein n=1 Tax=Oryza glumipatula TaxID=40148 RepID=A0A0E0A568_9ORYZ